MPSTFTGCVLITLATGVAADETSASRNTEACDLSTDLHGLIIGSISHCVKRYDHLFVMYYERLEESP